MSDVERDPGDTELRLQGLSPSSERGSAGRCAMSSGDEAMSYRPGETAWSAGTDEGQSDPGQLGSRSGDEQPERPTQILARTIENEIIPRLLQAHRTEARRKISALPNHTELDPREIESFAEFVMANDETSIQSTLAGHLARGLTLDDVCLELLAPTARHLGELWWTDACSFLDVTLGLCRLQHVLRDLGDIRDETPIAFNAKKSILLTAPPSNQHTFGLRMVEDFFRRAEWTVHCLPAASFEEMILSVRLDWFAVLGLSVGVDNDLQKLATLIATLRAASRNRSIVILVGGARFSDDPNQVTRIGADATASDARQAVEQAERLVTSIKRN